MPEYKVSTLYSGYSGYTDTVPEFWGGSFKKHVFTLVASDNCARAPYSDTKCEQGLRRVEQSWQDFLQGWDNFVKVFFQQKIFSWHLCGCCSPRFNSPANYPTPIDWVWNIPFPCVARYTVSPWLAQGLTPAITFDQYHTLFTACHFTHLWNMFLTNEKLTDGFVLCESFRKLTCLPSKSSWSNWIKNWGRVKVHWRNVWCPP